jgi:catechol 2,3-dioxygenase-like lactoylglutathione lyase family enzyme
VFGDYGKLEASQRNVLRLMFSNSRVRSAQPDWESVARFVVAAFRAETARAGATEKVMALVDELCRLSPEFAKMWKDNEVRRHGDGTKQLRHPTAGLMPTGWSASFLPRIWMRPRSPTTQESAMSTKEVHSNEAAGSTSVANLDMKLEVVVIPVSDVDRAKEFYSRLGWRLDADRSAGDNFRLVQFTPPGSGSSIQFGVNLTSAAPGSAQAMLLAVSDIEAARRQLVAQGVDASEVFHCAEGTACRFQGVGVRRA